MENLRKPPYKYCLVPECKNTIKSAPDKVFFQVPVGEKIRKQWCNIIRRREVSPSTTLHCCEDHFNIEEDTQNYVCYNIMKQEGVKVTLRLKKGVLPHIFHCQNRNITPTIRSNGMPRTSAADEAAVPGTESEGAARDPLGHLNVVIKVETLEEVGPEQLQPQDVAWAVKEEPESDDEESGGALQAELEVELKMEVEVGPEELQLPGHAARAESPGRESEMADVKSDKPLNRPPRIDPRKSHSYCSAHGCLTNDFENPELSFFKIPVEPERRLQWLQLILREDLIDKTTINRVCEIHFSPQDIRKAMRKTLKSTALPCLNLPDRLKKDVQTQTSVETAVSSNQTDRAVVSSSSQTDRRPPWVSDNETQTPATRKRKLKSDLNCPKRVKECENNQTGTESQMHIFHELCDRFLSSDLAELVKAETNLIQS